MDGKIIYMRDYSQYHVLDPKTKEDVVVGRIPDLFISAASFAAMQGKYYTSVTNQDCETTLYEIDCQKSSVTAVSTCRDISPLVILNQTPDGILELKAPDDDVNLTTYFDLFHPDTGETELVLQAPENDCFVQASIYKNTLYVLTAHVTPDAPSTWGLQAYELGTYRLIGETDLESIAPFLSQARVGEMAISGDYIFFVNFSEQGMIAKISDNEIVPVMEREFFRLVKYGDITKHTKEWLFCVRTTDECLTLRLDTGEINPFRAKLHKGYDIQYIMVDGDALLLCEEVTNPTGLFGDEEILSVYSYRDFVKQNES